MLCYKHEVADRLFYLYEYNKKVEMRGDKLPALAK